MRAISVIALALTLACSITHALFGQANPPIYTEIIPTSSGLPYNSANDARETFQAPNGKTVEVLVRGPIGAGIYSRTIKPGETPDTYFPAVVAEAMKAKAHHLVIPKGVYVFKGPKLCTDADAAACKLPSACTASLYYNCQPFWMIGQYPQAPTTVPNSITDLDIDFSGSELDFNAPVIGIYILEAQRLRLRNLTVDWPSLPIASLGTIVADPDNHGHNALVIDQKYPVTDPYRGGRVSIEAVDPWNGGTDPSDVPGTFAPTADNFFETYFIFGAPQPTYVGKTSAGSQTFSCKSCNFRNSPTDPTCNVGDGCANFDLFPVGTRVIVRHYTYNGFAFLVNWSNDIDFDNVTLRTSPGFGFSVSSNGGYRGFRLHHSQITRAPGRLISTASDAVNLALQADIIVEDTDIGYQGDDSINIHPTPAPVMSAKGSQISVAGVCDPDPMDNPLVGDEIGLYDQNSVYRGTGRVTASAGSDCGKLTLTLSLAIPGVNKTYTFVDLTQGPSARYIVRDNLFHDCRCHGTVADAPYGLIDNNAYFNNSSGAINVPGGAYGNGPGATNLAITNNIITAPGQMAQGYGAISMIAVAGNGDSLAAPIFEKIRLDNNVVEESPGPAIITTSTRYLSAENTSVLDSNLVRSDPTTWDTLTVHDAILVDKSASGTVCGTFLSGSMTGPIGIDPSARTIAVAPACGTKSPTH